MLKRRVYKLNEFHFTPIFFFRSLERNLEFKAKNNVQETHTINRNFKFIHIVHRKKGRLRNSTCTKYF